MNLDQKNLNQLIGYIVMFIIQPHFPIPCSSGFCAVQHFIQQNWRSHHVHHLSNDYSARHGRFTRGGKLSIYLLLFLSNEYISSKKRKQSSC